MAVMTTCPRCSGAVLSDVLDEPVCVNCGWREVALSSEVVIEVRAYLGKKAVGNGHVAKRIATGKPPASGWEKEKRRRERNAG